MSRGPFRVEIHIDAWLCATPFRLELMEHCHSAHSTTEISIGSTLGFAKMIEPRTRPESGVALFGNAG